MKHQYKILPDHLLRGERICLGTLISKSGSAPQVPGSSAIFSRQGLLSGTLGGGVLEGDAQQKAMESMESGKPLLYSFQLDADISDTEGALCGGIAKILLDPDPGMHLDCFKEMTRSLEQGKAGILITVVSKSGETSIFRYWQESDDLNPPDIDGKWPGMENAFHSCLGKGDCKTLENSNGDLAFIEPIFPEAKLFIAGAGHIGKALAHMARLLDFHVTVIDDRAEYANDENIPDADHIIVQPIGEAISVIPKNSDTYIVIVTRGHRDDMEALKACIGHDVPYIGMIGSRRKIRQVKEKFINEGWSAQEEFERVHAPIGIEIGSVSVQEIALSISAQLVRVRSNTRKGRKREIIASVILAAGESRRMGQPKMLLPFSDSTIIETVCKNAVNAIGDHSRVVLGAEADAIAENLKEIPVEKVINPEFRKGMLSSVQVGISFLPPGTTAVMILLGDQPMISSGIMDRMIEHYKRSEKKIIIATSNDKRGHPLLFSAEFISEILSYGEGQSLRDLLGNHPDEVEELEIGKPEILRDIDTPEDYENEMKEKY